MVTKTTLFAAVIALSSSVILSAVVPALPRAASIDLFIEQEARKGRVRRRGVLRARQSITPIPGPTDVNLQAILARHNLYRARYPDVPALTWNQDAADNAAAWVAQCNFAHQDRSVTGFGENLAAGYGYTEAVDAWYNENTLYDYDNPGFSSETGHFTQLVWKSTTSVGCAYTTAGQCAGQPGYPTNAPDPYIACEYSPGGNIVGGTNNNQYFIENVLRPTA